MHRSAAILAAIVVCAVPTIAVAAAPDAKPLGPCRFEDGPGPCVWDAVHMGNGTGQSYLIAPATANYPQGRTVYLSHREAHDLLTWGG